MRDLRLDRAKHARPEQTGLAAPGTQPGAAPALSAAGNLQVLRAIGARAKLEVSQPSDPDEREADEIAEAFVAGRAAPEAGSQNDEERVQRQCASCEDATVISRAAAPSPPAHAPRAGGLRRTLQGSRGETLSPQVRREYERFFRADLGAVHVHRDAPSAVAAQSLGARAFTVGSDVYFATSAWEPDSREGRKLLAHELAHTRQRPSARARRQEENAETTPAPVGAEHTEQPSMPATAAQTVTFADLRERDLYVALLSEQLSANYRNLITEIDPLLSEAGVYDLPLPENVFQRMARRQVFATQDEIARGDLYDAAHLSVWVEQITRALEYLGPLLHALGARNGRRAEEAAAARHDMLDTARELAASAYIRRGVAERELQARALEAEQRVADAVEYIKGFLRRVWRPELNDTEAGLYGLVIAVHLRQGMRLEAVEIREVLDTLRDEDPRLLEAALMRGGTVRHLLQMGVGGLQAYRAEGEGLLAGALRAEQESLLSQRPSQRVFSFPERLIAVGGFVLGAFQGIGDSIISNVRGIIELFTPSFWSGLVDFFTQFMPQFIDNEDFRFQLGQMLGLFSADEERRLATADPFEYGRTFGHVFGMALTEIVLSFIGLGFVLKALNGSARLRRIARPLVAIAETIGRSAVAARGLRIAQAIGEGINALSRRLRRLTMLLPDLTPNARLRRTLFELEEAERGIHEAFERTQELERLARHALAAGDEEAAQRHLRELADATDDLERRIAADGPPAARRAVAAESDAATQTAPGAARETGESGAARQASEPERTPELEPTPEPEPTPAVRPAEDAAAQIDRWIDEAVGDAPREGTTPLDPDSFGARPRPRATSLSAVDLSDVAPRRAAYEAAYPGYVARREAAIAGGATNRPPLSLEDYVRARHGFATGQLRQGDTLAPRDLGRAGALEQEAGYVLERVVDARLPGSANTSSFPNPYGEPVIPDHLPAGGRTVFIDAAGRRARQGTPFSARFVGDSKYRDFVPVTEQTRGFVNLARLSDTETLVLYVRWRPEFPTQLAVDAQLGGRVLPIRPWNAEIVAPGLREFARQRGVRIRLVSDPSWL